MRGLSARSGFMMRTTLRALGMLAVLACLPLATVLAADDPLSSSVGRFTLEALEGPVMEQVDLCSVHSPALQVAFSTASAELLRRHRAMVAEALGTERFAGLLRQEVPQDRFLLYRQQSAMRRKVNTSASLQKCERTLGEFTGMSDPFLRAMVEQFLVLVESSLGHRAVAPMQ